MLYFGRKKYRVVPKHVRDVFIPDAPDQLFLQIQELSEREVTLELLKYGVKEKEIGSMSEKVRRLILFDILSK
jgi:hypothetical protein